jgi:hypothetical protein
MSNNAFNIDAALIVALINRRKGTKRVLQAIDLSTYFL